MEYNFKEIEAKWQSRWRADKTYKVETDPSRPKFYVLDMFCLLYTSPSPRD